MLDLSDSPAIARHERDARPSTCTGSVRVEREPSGTSWSSYRERNKKSATAVPPGRGGRVALRSAIFDLLPGSSSSWSPNFHHFATPWAPRCSLTGGHVKVILAYGYSLSHGHHGFMTFTTDHREAAQPMGAAVARIEVLCDHQTVPT